MSTMAVASGAGRSSLNPNAPLFIPAAFQQVEDFSPEWWELVKTTSWFRDHWFRQHQEQETFDGDDEEEDVANLLPDSFDLGITEDSSYFEADFEDAAFINAAVEIENMLPLSSMKKEKVEFDSESGAETLLRSLSVKSPKNGVVKPLVDTNRYKEKPVQHVMNLKFSPRRIIQQPR